MKIKDIYEWGETPNDFVYECLLSNLKGAPPQEYLRRDPALLNVFLVNSFLGDVLVDGCLGVLDTYSRGERDALLRAAEEISYPALYKIVRELEKIASGAEGRIGTLKRHAAGLSPREKEGLARLDRRLAAETDAGKDCAALDAYLRKHGEEEVRAEISVAKSDRYDRLDKWTESYNLSVCKAEGREYAVPDACSDVADAGGKIAEYFAAAREFLSDGQTHTAFIFLFGDQFDEDVLRISSAGELRGYLRRGVPCYRITLLPAGGVLDGKGFRRYYDARLDAIPADGTAV